jgi:hypothetical protein
MSHLFGSQTTVIITGRTTLLSSLGSSLSVPAETVFTALSLVGFTVLSLAVVGGRPVGGVVSVCGQNTGGKARRGRGGDSLVVDVFTGTFSDQRRGSVPLVKGKALALVAVGTTSVFLESLVRFTGLGHCARVSWVYGREGGDVRWVSGLDEPGLLAMGSAGIVDICKGVFLSHQRTREEGEEEVYMHSPASNGSSIRHDSPLIDTSITSLATV